MLCFCICSFLVAEDIQKLGQTGTMICQTGDAGMYELDYSKMGARICQVRKLKGLSQIELAKKCGISLSFMGHIERGTKKMSMDTFATLCRELETDADGLLWGVAQPSEAAIQGMWKRLDQKKEDSYSMYIRIMKSVAEIMNET